MPDVAIRIESAEAVPFAIAPQLGFRLMVSNTPVEERIQAVLLRAQIQIEVTRRRYTPAEQQNLRDLFGEPGRWADTLKNLLWTHATVVVPQFVGSTTVEMPVPCTFDFTVAATKYFSGLADGEVPLCFQFSGTVFYQGSDGGMQAAPIPWDQEAKFRLSVAAWKRLMDAYYPNVAWLALRRDAFDKLYQYKVEQGIPTWEQALESLLAPVGDTVRS